MEDKPEQIQVPTTSVEATRRSLVPVTSEKKKDPRRVAAGKRLAAISKIAKERKKKLEEPKESSSDNMITYAGMVIALISLVLAYKSHQRETKELKPKYIPETVEVTRKANESKLDSLE